MQLRSHYKGGRSSSWVNNYSVSDLTSERGTQSETCGMVSKLFETNSRYFNRNFQRIDCILLITFSIPLGKNEVLNKKT